MYPRAVQLILLVKCPADIRLDMRDRGAEADARVGLQMAEETFAALSGEPAIDDVAESVIKSVRKTERLDRVVDTFIVVHAHAIAPARDRHRVTRVGIHFHVKKFRPKTPLRILRRKPKRPQTVVGRARKIASFKGNVVKSEIGSAALLQLQIVILRQRDAGENRELHFGPCHRAEPDQEKKEQGNEDGAGKKSRKISGEALSSHGGMIGRCASKDFGTASVNFSRYALGRRYGRRGSVD